MKINGLGTCMVLSLLVNLTGFAPFMDFLLSRQTGSDASPSPPQLQVRLLNAHLEPPHHPLSTPSHPPPPAPPRPTRPQTEAKPIQASKPVVLAPRPTQPGPHLPENKIPQAPPRPHHPSSEASPPSPPPPATAHPTEVETPTPTPSPFPEPASSHLPPLEPPVSHGDNPHSGVIPDKAAMPKGNPPNANTRKVLDQVGGKSFIRLLIKVYPDGHIEPEILVSSGVPELDQAVLLDLKDWRWEPARAAGRPVPSEKPIKLKLEAD